jgi:hypothetical protein
MIANWDELSAALPNVRAETPFVVVDDQGAAYEITAAEIDITPEGAIADAKLTITKL